MNLKKNIKPYLALSGAQLQYGHGNCAIRPIIAGKVFSCRGSGPKENLPIIEAYSLHWRRSYVLSHVRAGESSQSTPGCGLHALLHRAGRAQLGAGAPACPRAATQPISARPGPGTLQVAEHPPERRRRAKEPIVVLLLLTSKAL